MTPEQRQVLFDKYFSRVETVTERQQLEALLQNDEDAKREFGKRFAFEAVLTTGLRERLEQLEAAKTVAATSEFVASSGPATRRQFGWQVVAASGLGFLVPSIVAASYARETGKLREKNAFLDADNQRLHDMLGVIRKLLGAFSLAGDAPDGSTLGPGAVLSASNVITVAGYLDPDLIQRVHVVWDQDGPDQHQQEIYSRSNATKEPVAGAGLVPFSAQRAVAVKPGRTVRVHVTAEAVPAAVGILDQLQHGRGRLARQAWFLGSEYGLVVKPAQDWIITSLLADSTLTDEFFLLEGSAFVDGQIAVCHVAQEGAAHLLARPMEVRQQMPLAPVQLDLGYVANGSGTIRLLHISPETAEQLSQVPLDEPLAQLPASIKQISLPVRVELPSATMRAVQFVTQSGGWVRAHNSQEEIRDAALYPSQSQVQVVDLSMCRSVTRFTRLRGLRQLQVLHLSGTRVDDAALTGLHEHHPDLQYLELSDTLITDAGVISEIVRCPHLVMLGLSSNRQITNRSVSAIADSLSKLKDLSLRSTAVTSVLPLQKLKQLEQLHVSDTQIPASELDELVRLIPGLMIER